jgi:hypothetical protein
MDKSDRHEEETVVAGRLAMECIYTHLEHEFTIRDSESDKKLELHKMTLAELRTEYASNVWSDSIQRKIQQAILLIKTVREHCFDLCSIKQIYRLRHECRIPCKTHLISDRRINEGVYSTCANKLKRLSYVQDDVMRSDIKQGLRIWRRQKEYALCQIDLGTLIDLFFSYRKTVIRHADMLEKTYPLPNSDPLTKLRKLLRQVNADTKLAFRLVDVLDAPVIYEVLKKDSKKLAS